MQYLPKPNNIKTEVGVIHEIYIPEYGMETSYTACQQEVQNSTTGGKIENDAFFLVRMWTNAGTLGHNSKQCPL
jgi:hypothetical protein